MAIEFKMRWKSDEVAPENGEGYLVDKSSPNGKAGKRGHGFTKTTTTSFPGLYPQKATCHGFRH